MNIITIKKSARGYRVQLPYVPCESARRGFHSIKMVWDKQVGTGREMGRVTWFIPEARLNEAQDFIAEWYTRRPAEGKPPYLVADEITEEAEPVEPVEQAVTTAA